ncbi:ion channel [Rhodobacteraceae bacterium]|nr:ion channel [Paracoccaceae bacterium]
MAVRRWWAVALRFIWTRGLGWDINDAEDSNRRRLAIRICLIWAMTYSVVSLVFSGSPGGVDYSAARSFFGTLLLCAGLLVFVQVVLLMPFREGGEWIDGKKFKVEPARLLFDSLVSGLFLIVAFSLIYQSTGLVFKGEKMWPGAIDALYFSAVTFSTLGYGDFAPVSGVRILAAFEALIGNLHLGMIVDSTFAALKN